MAKQSDDDFDQFLQRLQEKDDEEADIRKLSGREYEDGSDRSDSEGEEDNFWK